MILMREPATGLGKMADAALAVLARQDPSGPAFRELYERHKGDVHRFLLRLLDDRDLAEDLLQETFFRVYWHLDRYDPTRPFRPWLLRIARNAGINALKGRRKTDPPGEDDPPERAASDRVPRQAELAEERGAARRALAALDEEDRALLVMRHGLALKLEEIAESLGCTERTVRNRLHAAVERLTRAMLIGGEQ